MESEFNYIQFLDFHEVPSFPANYNLHLIVIIIKFCVIFWKREATRMLKSKKMYQSVF